MSSDHLPIRSSLDFPGFGLTTRRYPGERGRSLNGEQHVKNVVCPGSFETPAWPRLPPVTPSAYPPSTQTSQRFSVKEEPHNFPFTAQLIAQSIFCLAPLVPKGRIFPLSQPESESMKTYIKEELAKGFIRPSTSPASAGFFLVKKRDGGLRPCIEYRGLNENTVKFRYPLPLVPAALEQLRQARYYTKLDLRNA